MGGRVLILCTGNSCRSQMAEGLWRQLGGKAWEVYSAGSNPAGYVHPRAIEVMREIGLDISRQESKSLDRFRDEPFDLVITVCDRARESCPVFPGARETLHWPFPDPAHATGSEAEVLAAFRTVRDQIAKTIRDYLAAHEA